MFHARRTSTSHAEEADEGANRDDDALGTLDSVRSRPIEDEGAQSLGGIGASVIPESIVSFRQACVTCKILSFRKRARQALAGGMRIGR